MAKPSAITVAAGSAGLIAGTLAFGAVQFALGNDLLGQDFTFGARSAAVQQEHNVNRQAKSDRLAPPPAMPSGSTLSFRVPSLPDTLVVTRIVPSDETKDDMRVSVDSMAVRSTVRSVPVKRSVACEPAVSVLTEVAKLLDASRCVT